MGNHYIVDGCKLANIVPILTYGLSFIPPVPLSIPAPRVTGISSSALNVSWNQPPDGEIRGLVVLYNLFQITASNDPFAPPEVEMVSCKTSLSLVHVLLLSIASKIFLDLNLNKIEV